MKCGMKILKKYWRKQSDLFQGNTGCARKRDGFRNFKTSFPATRRFHTVIVHSAVWSLVEMERWLMWVNKIFPLCLKTLFHLKKPTCVSGAAWYNISGWNEENYENLTSRKPVSGLIYMSDSLT
jgi:hypothetical protein